MFSQERLAVRILMLRFMALIGLFVLAGAGVSNAQEKAPPLPRPLQALSEEGAQIRYMGMVHGLHGWVTIKGGQEQYFYSTRDGEAMVMGLLFNKEGELLTLEQISALRGKDGGALDLFAGAPLVSKDAQESLEKPLSQYKSPAEKLYEDMEGSNWLSFGSSDAPVIYSFIDPQCPHCHAFFEDLRRDYIENGLVQLRMIPVGFREETLAQAAFLLAAPDPEGRWYRHLDGDESALPVTKSINQQGVQRNLSIMQSWRFNVTPLTVYRSAEGEVKIVQGRARNVAELVADLP